MVHGNSHSSPTMAVNIPRDLHIQDTEYYCEDEQDETTTPLLDQGMRRQSLASTLSYEASDLPVYRKLSPLDTTAPNLNVLHSPCMSSIGSWSENVSPCPSPPHPTTDRDGHSVSLSLSNVSSNLSTRMRDLVRAFSSRTQRVKEKNAQPPTPSSESSIDSQSLVSMATLSSDKPTNRLRLDSLLGGGSECGSEDKEEVWFGLGKCRFKIPSCVHSLHLPAFIQPQSKLFISWLFIVTMAFLYNAYVIPLRGVFPYQTDSNLHYWLAIDYLCDAIYLIDILYFKSRISFIEDGMQQTNPKVMFLQYRRKFMFKMDVISLIPLDLLYFVNSAGFPWYRLPRLLKMQSFWEFFDRIDQAASSGHALRVVRTMTYMIFLIHLETCGYYAVSKYEGLDSNRWVYNGQGNAYIRCFYLATKTATSIGNNPKPTNILEYSFMTIYWLSGVFVFALLIGQIRNIFEAASIVETNFTKTRDITIAYMKSINIPPSIQNRVRMWFDHNWRQQKTLDETSLYRSLPLKLQLDMAVNVHYETLSKVTLFQDCDTNLLYDLLLKLKAVLCLPGDYICRKGEVGKEMYIVSNGQVEVVGGPNNQIVFATLHAGSVFGEISLLALSGGNRRTADVRSKGFTNVFILSKKDFESAMYDYPEAQKLLKKRAKKLLCENAARERETKKEEDIEEIIKTPRETPKLLKTVLKVMNRDSETMNRLSGCYNSKAVSPIIGVNEVNEVNDVTATHVTEKDELDMNFPEFGSQFSLSNIPDDLSDGDSLSDVTIFQDNVFHPDPHQQPRSISQIVDRRLESCQPLTDVTSQSFTGFNTVKPGKIEANSLQMTRLLHKMSYSSEVSLSDCTIGSPSTYLLERPKSSIKHRRAQGSASSTKNVTFEKPEKAATNHVNFVARRDSEEIPAENKVTCSADVHREKSRTPSSGHLEEPPTPVPNSTLSWLFSMDNVRETLC